jgi:hypothetical protein
MEVGVYLEEDVVGDVDLCAGRHAVGEVAVALDAEGEVDAEVAVADAAAAAAEGDVAVVEAEAAVANSIPDN